MDLIAGANTIIPTEMLHLEIQVFGINITELDFSAYCLDHSNKVRGDDDMIFYGQLQNIKHTIQLEQTQYTLFHLNLPKVDPQIQRIAICATLADEQHNFSRLSHLNFKLLKQTHTLARAQISGKQRQEVALILGEFYRHKMDWKFKMIAQGFNGGLKKLAEHYGVEITEDPNEQQSTITEVSSIDHNNSNNPTQTHILKEFFSSPFKAIEKRKFIKEFQKQLVDIFTKQNLSLQDQQLLIQFCENKNIQLTEALAFSEQQSKSFLFHISKTKSKKQIREFSQFLKLAPLILEQALAIHHQTNEAQFIQMLKDYLADGILEQSEIEKLNKFSHDHQLNQQTLMRQTQREIRNFFNYTLASILSDGGISVENELLIQNLCQYLHPEPQLLQQIEDAVKVAKKIDQIKKGNAPTLQTGEIIVKNSEFVYLHQKNVGIQHTKKEYITGELFVTSDRIILKANTAYEILISNIISIELYSEFIEIIAKTKKGSGRYHIGKEANIVEAYINFTIKRFHRQLDFQQTSGNTRHIPQNIKNAVWQKCQGKCVQCGSNSYLEFDHIIPFSKGGSNSENNIQILCRQCNLAKSNQI